ncbi:unnamed protein product [Moneuplotes crassus]|uniref:Acyltransferase 3 domain-containing protein n=1 Tax=Euplotes crassus TaxID=5936 RepID=A0AAD1U2B6_EUPCR|nr:unnamed protein product [Moneuplotes crassus]
MSPVKTNDCVDAVRDATSNGGSTVLLMKAGKGINDLGDYDSCGRIPGFKYGLLTVVQGGFFKMHLGLCLPQKCRENDFQVLVDGIIKASDGFFDEGSVTFPAEFSVNTSGWRLVGIIFFSLFGLLLLFGLIVQLTPLFKKQNLEENQNKDPAQEKSMLGKVFISFSPARNLKKSFTSTYNPKDNLRVLNGVRFFSFLYVVLGHTYQEVLLHPSVNITDINSFMQPLLFQIVPGSYFAVDVFFFISGFLGAYLMILKFSKGSMNIPKIYLHRYLRLAPSVFFAMMFALTFYQYLGDGPLWPTYSTFWTLDCPKYFWAFLTFINSIYPSYKTQCMGWLWYLSHDFIFFLFLPFQVWIYVKKRAIGYSLAFLILLGNIISVFSIVMKYNISVSMKNDSNYVEYLYFKPWCRIGTYQVGIIFGMLYFEFITGDKEEGDKSRIGFKIFKSYNISRLVRYVSYVLGLAVIIALVFMITPENRLFGRKDENGIPMRHFSRVFSAFYTSLSRPLYVIGLALILSGPLVGKGSALQFILGGEFYATWCKFTFFGYIIHLFIFSFYFNQLKQSIYLSHLSVLWIYVTAMVITLLLAVPFSIAFESPFIQLERLVLFPVKKKNEPKPKLQASSSGSLTLENSLEKKSAEPLIPYKKI